MPRTVSSPGPKSHDFCGQRGFQEAQHEHRGAYDVDRHLYRATRRFTDRGFEVGHFAVDHGFGAKLQQQVFFGLRGNRDNVGATQEPWASMANSGEW